MDQWLLAVTSDLAKGLAKDLEVPSTGPVLCHFSLPPFSLPCVVPYVAFHSTVVNQNITWLLFKPSFLWPNTVG